ncbi:type I-A CRISPR-associated protein Cas7/Csa2 [Ignicoccus islandicus]|nr:type I-A CRISPR-associated protein Cas7/Csa2 [Ignicoccus islandicus]
MSYVGISLSARILLNADALNMAESVGNVTRHRRAPVVIKTKDGLQVLYVPAISGESIAHAYQVHLAEVAKRYGLPVCKCCEKGIFVKSTDENALNNCGIQIPQSLQQPGKKGTKKSKESGGIKKSELEKVIIQQCVVEDVGGFLNSDNTVKRTSRFRVGYMLPTLDSLKAGAVGTEPELHVRYAGAEQSGGQMLYYVEIGSALYNLNFSLDVSNIGVLSSDNTEYGEEVDSLEAPERFKRAEAALKALQNLMGSMLWGAKRTRFNPQWEVMSLVVAVTDVPFEVSPGNEPSYLFETVERLQILSNNSKVYYFDKEGLKKPQEAKIEVIETNSYLEAIAKASEEALARLGESLKLK